MSEEPTAEQIADALAVLRSAGYELQPPSQLTVAIDSEEVIRLLRAEAARADELAERR